MRIALDTNILVYAEGVNDEARRSKILKLLQTLPPEETYVPLQSLGELFYVLIRKAAVKPTRARSIVLEWLNRYGVIETSQDILLPAMELSSHHGLRIWDAIIVAAASSAGCRLLLSEDLQHGFTWSGVTVVNPFSEPVHALLSSALDI